MKNVQEDLGKYSISDSYNGQGFSNGDFKMQPREIPNFKEIPNPGFEQLLSNPNGNESPQNNDQILNVLYDHIERDLFAYQAQQQQQASMQGFNKFSPTQNYQDISNPLFPELDKNFMNQSIDQLGNKSNFNDSLNISTESKSFNRANSLNSQTINQPVFQSTDPKFVGGQNLSPEGVFGLNLNQIPELQNFDPADLKDPAKLEQLYEKLAGLLGTLLY